MLEQRKDRKPKGPQGKDLETGISLICSRNGKEPQMI